MKHGDKVRFTKTLPHPKGFDVTPKIFATVVDQIDHVVMVLPHNSGHEMIVNVSDIVLRKEKE